MRTSQFDIFFSYFSGGLALSVALGIFLPASTLRGGWKAAAAGADPCPGARSPEPEPGAGGRHAPRRRWLLCNTRINGVFPHWWTVNEKLSSLAAWDRLRATGEDLRESSAGFPLYSLHLRQTEQTRILSDLNKHFKLSMMSKAAGSTSGCLDILNVKSSKYSVSLLWVLAGNLSLQSRVQNFKSASKALRMW